MGEPNVVPYRRWPCLGNRLSQPEACDWLKSLANDSGRAAAMAANIRRHASSVFALVHRVPNDVVRDGADFQLAIIRRRRRTGGTVRRLDVRNTARKHGWSTGITDAQSRRPTPPRLIYKLCSHDAENLAGLLIRLSRIMLRAPRRFRTITHLISRRACPCH